MPREDRFERAHRRLRQRIHTVLRNDDSQMLKVAKDRIEQIIEYLIESKEHIQDSAKRMFPPSLRAKAAERTNILVLAAFLMCVWMSFVVISHLSLLRLSPLTCYRIKHPDVPSESGSGHHCMYRGVKRDIIIESIAEAQSMLDLIGADYFLMGYTLVEAITEGHITLDDSQVYRN